MRYHFFLHYGWFFQNLEKDFIPILLHTTVGCLWSLHLSVKGPCKVASLHISKRNKTLQGHFTEQYNHQKITNKMFWENCTFIGTLIKKSLWNVTCNSNEILDPKQWIQFWWIDIAPIWSAMSNWYCCSNLKEI